MKRRNAGRRGLMCLAMLAAATTAWAAAPPQTEAGSAVDMDNSDWLFNLTGVIPGGSDLTVLMLRRKGRFLRGMAWSEKPYVRRPFNKGVHEVRAADLALDGNLVTGSVDVVINPDPWTPPDQRRWKGRITLGLRSQADLPTVRDVFSGTFAAQIDGRATEGKAACRFGRMNAADMRDFSTRLRVFNGWITDDPPLARRLVMGLNVKDGRVAGVKLGCVSTWGKVGAISHLGPAPDDTVGEVTATETGFKARVSLTRPEPMAPAGTPPAQYTFDLDAVRVQDKLGGTVEVTLKRGDEITRQTGWFQGRTEEPWRPEPATLSAEPEPRCKVEAELLETCPVPTREQIAPYTEALSVYVYRVRKVLEGKLNSNRIAVTHWAVKHLLNQPVTELKPGDVVEMALCPIDDVGGVLEEIFSTEADSALYLDRYYHCRQKLKRPDTPSYRGSYDLPSASNYPLMFRLKDQLKLVVLGGCYAWFLDRAELHYFEENRKTPVAMNLSQKRSGIQFQTVVADTYLARMPKMEWIVIIWDYRWLSGTFSDHGLRARTLVNSTGYKYDLAHLDELLKPEDSERVRVSEVGWVGGPWGWRRPGNGMSDKPVMKGWQELLGTYVFVPERWAEFEAMVKKAVANNSRVKFLIVSQPWYYPYGPDEYKVRDYVGTDVRAMEFQNGLMRALEKKYPYRFFFYDLVNLGDNGLTGSDFLDGRHASRTGATHMTMRIEVFRREAEKLLARNPRPDVDAMVRQLTEFGLDLRERREELKEQFPDFWP